MSGLSSDEMQARATNADRVKRFDGSCSFAKSPLQPAMTIDGKDATSATTTCVVNPATEEIIACVPDCSRDQLDTTVATAASAFASWSRVPFKERRRAILEFADCVEQCREELASLLVMEQGKPRERAIGEINSGLAHCRAICDFTLDVELLEDTPQRRVELHRRPIGVVGAIVPWNYPVLLAFWKLTPALLAGNTFILKPSPTAPLAGLRLARIARGVFPDGAFSAVSGNEAGAWLAAHPGVQKIAFTGSPATGKKVMAAAAPTLKRLTLELGGNDAGIVLPGTDIDRVARDLFWAAFSNCGQVCAGLKRLYVPEVDYDDLCAKLAEIAQAVVIGDGRCAGVQMGPVQNRNQLNRVSKLVDLARKGGATVLCGGELLDGPGYFYAPAIVRDVADGVHLVDDEQFGPALPVISYQDLEDAIGRANGTPYGLGGSVWSHDTEKAVAVAARFETGSAWVNEHPSMSPHIPFGGIKDSGIGVELSQHGLDAYTNMFILNIKALS